MREVLPRVASFAEQGERDREIPTELANELKDRGLFRLLLPRSVGGAEMEHPDFLDIVEAFAEVDASVAWCVNQNNVFSTRSSVMPAELAGEIWSEPRAVVTNGPPQWTEVVPEGDGYRLSGRWNFSSGVRHATWVAALTSIRDGGTSGECEEPRTMVLPKSDATLVDNWQVSGLRGTGSLGFEVRDVFVPRVRSFCADDTSREPGPLYAMPMVLMFAAGFSTVALGAARASLDALIEMAGGKTIQAGAAEGRSGHVATGRTGRGDLEVGAGVPARERDGRVARRLRRGRANARAACASAARGHARDTHGGAGGGYGVQPVWVAGDLRP